MTKHKNSDQKLDNNQWLLLGIIVLALIAGGGVIGGFIELVIGLIVTVIGLVGGIIGAVIGLVFGLLGVILGFAGAIIGIVVGTASIWIPLLIIVAILKTVSGNNPSKQKRKITVSE